LLLLFVVVNICYFCYLFHHFTARYMTLTLPHDTAHEWLTTGAHLQARRGLLSVGEVPQRRADQRLTDNGLKKTEFFFAYRYYHFKLGL
jgi:hypothetical protein